jgi:hypothetical protein
MRITLSAIVSASCSYLSPGILISSLGCIVTDFAVEKFLALLKPVICDTKFNLKVLKYQNLTFFPGCPNNFFRINCLPSAGWRMLSYFPPFKTGAAILFAIRQMFIPNKYEYKE